MTTRRRLREAESRVPGPGTPGTCPVCIEWEKTSVDRLESGKWQPWPGCHPPNPLPPGESLSARERLLELLAEAEALDLREKTGDRADELPDDAALPITTRREVP